jgi:hypothetical protein
MRLVVCGPKRSAIKLPHLYHVVVKKQVCVVKKLEMAPAKHQVID